MQPQFYARENDNDVVAADPPRPSKSSRVLVWTEPMVEAFLEALIEQVRLGKRSESGFKPEAYAYALPKVQARMIPENYKGECLCADRNKVRAKVSSLKALYAAYEKLLEESGFGRDAETGLIIADDDVWDPYLNVKSANAQ